MRSFADHIDGIVFKAKQRANQILRCFVSKDKWVLTKAFAVFVRPQLEYCSPGPTQCTVTAINKLESVQRMFTKGMMSLSYDARLQLFGLERLELRRIHCDLITCFKITHQLVSVSFSSMFELSASRATRGHPFKLAYPDSRIKHTRKFFSCSGNSFMEQTARICCYGLKVNNVYASSSNC